MEAVIERGINYFIQRNPNSLQRFRWRVDQKSPDVKTDFEDAFEKLSPALLQSFSLADPKGLFDWCDYRPMKKYMIEKGEFPDYLMDKFPHLESEQGLNLQKILRDDIRFVDSKNFDGVQVADLLASGLRKLLRKNFSDNQKAAQYLGRLMIQAERTNPPLKFASFGQDAFLDDDLAYLVNIMKKSCRPMFHS